MKICIAQTKSKRGDVKHNLQNHLDFIKLAVSYGADFIAFPELSLTGYEPNLAETLSVEIDKQMLNHIQKVSNKNRIGIGVGLPIKSESGIMISMAILLPDKPRIIYSKQILHSDEFPFFIEGNNQVLIKIHNEKIAPAICYESLQTIHAQKAIALGADIYLASAAKAQKGIDKALDYFPGLARKYSVHVLMSNSIGDCDSFVSAGLSSVWDKNGNLLGQLDNENEGVILFDTKINKIKVQKI